MNPFLCKDHAFSAYTSQHYLPLVVVFLSGMVLIYLGIRAKDQDSKKQMLFYISLIPFFGAFLLYPMSMIEGDLNIIEDLPFHLCRFLALTAPFVILKNKRFWIGIFYFWIMVGTLNANITPDIEYGYPNWRFFAYWMMHGFLLIIPVYYIMVLNIRINWRDFFNAYWMMNVFLLFTLIINLILGSNYMYTRAKPPVASLLDILGPWPIYLISGQVLVLVLFFIVFLPFLILRKVSLSVSP